ncbi:DUF397 domain-containing protein [Streptomyces sp. SGAir0957]
MTTNSGRFLTASELEEAVWTKSSYSGDSNGQCVEVAALTAAPFSGKRAVRDSKVPNGPVLVLDEPSMTTFLTYVANGRFDV